MVLKCMTLRAGACITHAPHACGTIAYWRTGSPLSAKSGRRRPGYGSCIWLAFRSGFDRAVLGVFQTLASKRRRGAADVPLSRADLYR